MKFSFLIILLIFYSCSSSKNLDVSEYPIQKCENINIVELAVEGNDLKHNKLKNLNGLGFAYSYTMVSSKLDTLAEEKIRRKTELITSKVVKYSIPEIVMISDSSKFKNRYPFMTSRFYRIKYDLMFKREFKPKIIKGLTSKSNIRKQLIFKLSTNLMGSNTITAIILDSEENELLYFDEISFNCDIRNDKAIIQALNYLIDRIK